MEVPDFETVKVSSEGDTIAKLTERAQERKIKGNGKLVETHSKRQKKEYGTRSVTHKSSGKCYGGKCSPN